MASVSIGGVKEPQALIMTVEQKVRQPLNPQRSLVGMVPAAHRSGSHRKTTRSDASLAQCDRVSGCELAGKRRKSIDVYGPGKSLIPDPGRADRSGCTDDELSALHNSSTHPTFQLCVWTK